jgi:LPS-assembly lipoprotein
MLNKKIIMAIIIMFILSSCGFKPILAKDSAGYKSLTEIKITNVNGPDRLKTKYIVDEEFSNDSHSIPKYELNIDVNYSSSSMGVMKDSQITRYRIHANLNYTLVDIESKKIVDSSSISLNGSYDADESDFANYTAESQVSDNLLRELLKDLKSRLSLVITDLEGK